MHSFEVHSNESVCRKSGRLGPEQVITLSDNQTSFIPQANPGKIPHLLQLASLLPRFLKSSIDTTSRVKNT